MAARRGVNPKIIVDNNGLKNTGVLSAVVECSIYIYECGTTKPKAATTRSVEIRSVRERIIYDETAWEGIF